jgi:transcriptional regulator with XRE-family HTH domain
MDEQITFMRPGVARQRRRRLGLTQGDIADSLGVTTATVCRWEKARMPVAWDRVGPLAAALGGKRGLYESRAVVRP